MCESEPNSVVKRLEHAYATYLPPAKGFLPPVVPVDQLPKTFESYVRACDDLPGRFGGTNSSVRPWLDGLFSQHDPAIVQVIEHLSLPEQQKLMTVLSMLAHAYRWEKTPPDRAAFELTHLMLPPGLDETWTHTARVLGQPRVGSLWNMALCNWSLVSRPAGSSYSVDELTLENLRIGHRWLNPPLASALEVFILTFIETEARGEAVVQMSVDLTRSVADDDIPAVLHHLESLGEAIKVMNHVFYKNIRAKLIDPAKWNECIKPIYGWGLGPGESPLEGASGLQLGSIQCADAVLGIENETFLPRAAVESRRYMPEYHRLFLSIMDETRLLVPSYVRERDNPLLTQRYNECVDALRAWRQAHQRRGALYLRGNGSGPMGGTTGMTIASCGNVVDQFHSMMQERIDETMQAHIISSVDVRPTPYGRGEILERTAWRTYT